MTNSKKTFGVVANFFQNSSDLFAKENLTYTMQGNVDAVVSAGALPLLIPIGVPADVNQYLSKIDALLLPGGQDVSPDLYGETPSDLLGATSTKRDTFENALIKEAIGRDIPILAICRGAQLVNVYFGGSLYQDESMIKRSINIEHDQIKIPVQNDLPSHWVQLEDPALIQMFGTNKIQVNSLHHQAIKKLGKGLTITARAEDGVIEGFNDSKHHIAAYQWHPEMMFRSDKDMLKIFTKFISDFLE